MFGRRHFKARKERLKARSRLGVLARERNRMAQSSAAIEVGRICFSGTMFGGNHVIRCLHRDGDQMLLLDIDDRPFKPETYRGVLRLLSRRLVRSSA